MPEIRFDLVGDASRLTSSLDDATDALKGVSAEADKATKAIEKNDSAVDDWRKSFKGLSQKELEEVNKQVPTTTDNIKTLTASLAPAAGAVAFAATAALGLAAHASAAGDAVALLSARTGVTQGTVVALQSAMRAGGADAGALNEALGGLVGKLKEAQVDGSSGAQAFADLGVALKDANGVMRSTDDILADVLDSIAAAPNETERATRAVALLGESGGKMAAALSGGNAQLEEWRVKTEGVSAALQAGAVDGAAYNAAMEELSISIETLKLRLGNDLLPEVAAVASGMAQAVGPIHSVLSTLSHWSNVPARVAEGFSALGSAIRSAITADTVDTADQYAASWVQLPELITETADATSEYFGEWDVNDEVLKKMADTGTALDVVAVKTGEAAAKVVEYGDAFNAMVKQAENATVAENDFATEAAARAQAQIDRDLEARAAAAARLAQEQLDHEATLARLAAEAEAYAIAEEQKRIAHEERIANTRAAEEALSAYILSTTRQVVSGVLSMITDVTGQLAATQTQQAEDAQATVEQLAAELAATGETITVEERKQLMDRLAAAQEAAAIQEAEAKEARQKAHRATQAAAMARAIIDTASAALALVPSFAYLGPGAPLAAAGVAAAAFGIQAAAIMAAPAPQYRTGGVVGEDAPRVPGGLSDQRMIVAEPGEVILRPDQARALGGGMGSEAVGYLRQIAEHTKQAARALSRPAGPGYAVAGALSGGYR